MANDEPISDEKIAAHCALVKHMIELQDKERVLLRQIVLSLGLKGRSYTGDEMEVRRYELLTAAGLKTDGLSFNAHRIVKRKELQRRIQAERDEMKEKASEVSS